MSQYAHKGQILPLMNQMIPIEKSTTFHASYDEHLNGMRQEEVIHPLGMAYAANFNGTDAGIYTQRFTNITNQFTIEFWINTSDNAAKVIAGQAGSIGIVKNTTGIKFVIWNKDWQTNYLLPTNKWVHVAAVYDGTNRYLYFDGVLQGSYATSGNIPYDSNFPSAKFSIGYWDGISSFIENYVNASICDVRLWNIARNQDEIKTYMNKPLTGRENGLLGNWKLTEREGNVYYDSSMNQNDGIKIGTITCTYGPTVASVQKYKGKFGGAVLIEPDSQNVIINNNWGTDTAGLIREWTNEYPYIGDKTIKMYHPTQDGSTLNCYLYNTTNINYNIYSDEWTFSCYVRRKDGAPVNIPTVYMYANAQDDGARINSNAGPTGIIDCGDGWYRVYRTEKLSEPAQIQLVGFTGLTKNTEWYMNGWMLEPRFGPPTSWIPIASSRPLGRLWYPKELINLNSFTISCWFNIPYVHQTPTKNYGIYGNWYHSLIELCPMSNRGETGLSLVCTPSANYSPTRKIHLRWAGSARGIFGTTTIQDNTWYHLIITYDGITYKVYVNGNLEGSHTSGVSSIYNDTVLMIGGGYFGKGYSLIDEVRIESRAISEEEVQAWAASGLHYNYLDYSYCAD